MKSWRCQTDVLAGSGVERRSHEGRWTLARHLSGDLSELVTKPPDPVEGQLHVNLVHHGQIGRARRRGCVGDARARGPEKACIPGDRRGTRVRYMEKPQRGRVRRTRAARLVQQHPLVRELRYVLPAECEVERSDQTACAESRATHRALESSVIVKRNRRIAEARTPSHGQLVGQTGFVAAGTSSSFRWRSLRHFDRQVQRWANPIAARLDAPVACLVV